MALFAYFFGGTLVRLSVLLFFSSGAPFPDGPVSWAMLLGGALIAAIGAFCAIRVFAQRNGAALMIGCGVLAMVPVVASLVRA